MPGTILFLTDGAESAATRAFKAQADSGRSQPVMLAVGTERGGPLRSGTDSFVEKDGVRVFARMDVAALKRFGDDTGVPVATFTPDSDDDVAWVQRHVQSHLAQKQSAENTRWKDEGWWLTIPIALLGVLWFRKGWTVRWVVGLLLATALATPQQELRAQASAPEAAPPAWRFADLWLTHDQQGRLAFERGDYAGAAALFDDPMWRGVAQYRAGQYAKAVQSFALMDSPESDFNQGDALARQGKYKAAAARYRQALKRRPQWPAATANLALVEKLAAQAEQPKEGEEPPDIKPDEVKYDSESKPPEGEGKKTEMGAVQSAETWMRAIQTTPTELLQRKFALQRSQAQPAAGGKP